MNDSLKFFNNNALTTTIPAQFVKKFNAEIVPIYIERIENNKFKLHIYKRISFCLVLYLYSQKN